VIFARIGAFVLALLTAAGLAVATSGPAAAAPTGFNDVPNSQPFYGDISWLVGKGITKGYPDGGFHPDASVSRQAMAAFLYRFSGASAAACTQPPFPDVAASSQFCTEIAWLADQKVTGGYPDKNFHPANSVTRQAMAAFLYRLAHNGADAPACSGKGPFADVAATDQFCGAITWLAGQDITGGYADGGFHPAEPVTRQAMAAFLHRFADPSPAASVSRYIRTADANTMSQAAQADAAAAQAAEVTPRLHLLQIGAQTIKDLPSAGVLLTNTQIRLTYAQLVTLLRSYTDAYAAAAPGVPVTIAIGTNSDGNFDNYPATEKGNDWWTEVVEPLRAVTPANMVIVGANDVEPGFSATMAQAQQWKTAFLTDPNATLVMNGSADGCPTRYGDTTTACNHGWTPAQLHALNSGARVQVLPQISLSAQALQWGNIAMAGSGEIDFIGSLTQHALCGSTACSWSPARGWIALWNALTAAGRLPAGGLQYATDLVETT
jgi:hypothetical protein